MNWQRYGPELGPVFVMAPGDHGQLSDAAPSAIADALGRRGIAVLRFELPPTSTSDETALDLEMAAAIRSAAQVAGCSRLILGGLSRGGRVATSLCSELHAQALVAIAYPFHPRHDPKPRGRAEALARVCVPTLLCQGTRDTLGNRQQVVGYRLPPRIEIHWIEDATHSLKARARSGHTMEAQMEEVADAIARFVRTLANPRS